MENESCIAQQTSVFTKANLTITQNNNDINHKTFFNNGKQNIKTRHCNLSTGIHVNAKKTSEKLCVNIASYYCTVRNERPKSLYSPIFNFSIL